MKKILLVVFLMIYTAIAQDFATLNIYSAKEKNESSIKSFHLLFNN